MRSRKPKLVVNPEKIINNSQMQTKARSQKPRRKRTPFSANVTGSVALSNDAPLPLVPASQFTFRHSVTSTLSTISSSPEKIWNFYQAIKLDDFSVRSLAGFLRSHILPAAMRLARNTIQMPRLLKYGSAKPAIRSTANIRKKMELHQSRITALQQHDEPDEKIQKLLENEQLHQIELVANDIREHAARRVDLFFYLLVAMRNTGLNIKKGKTIAQNGVGSTNAGTQACHSSMFPNLELTAAATNSSASSLQYLMSYLFSSQEPEYQNFANSHFMQWLNSTVELPKLVNDFDGHLEGRWQQSAYTEACIDILHACAGTCTCISGCTCNKITPIEGMNEYFIFMKRFFNHFEKKYIRDEETPEAIKRIWRYQKEGTLKAANRDWTVNRDYIYLQLRLSTAETAIAKTAYAVSAKTHHQALKGAYKKIQKEIFSTPSNQVSQKPSAR